MIMITQQSLAFADAIQNNVSELQAITVTGVVFDETGASLPGVNVTVKGTPQAVTTGPDGRYSITVPDRSAVLVFSYIGFAAVEQTVNDRSSINVTLYEDTQMLSEVVVIGFGTQKKANLTGSVGVASSVELESRSVMTSTQALQGLIPGLNISQSDGGFMERSASINIRGIATIGQGSTGSPLILIDGMEGDINSINPQDIENISVLRDAAASSIYGSRAPFGVILVTTKSGKRGKPVFSYNNSFRWNDPVLLPKMTDSYTFATYVNDATTNAGQAAHFSQEHLQRIMDFQSGKLKETLPINSSNPSIWADGFMAGNDNVDWYRVIYGNWAFSQNHNINVSGGTDAINYYISADYLDQNGLMKINTDKYDRYTLSSKVGVKFTNWATMNYTVRFVREDYERPSYFNDEIFWRLGNQGWPTVPLYDPNGNLFKAPSPALDLRDGGRRDQQVDRMTQQVQFILEPVKNWKTFMELNMRTVNTHRHWALLPTYNHNVAGEPYVATNTSKVHEDYTKNNLYNVNVYSEYSLNLASGHNFKGMAGFQAELYKAVSFDLERDGIIVPELPSISITTGLDPNGNPTTPPVNGTYDHWATAGFFGRLNYDYQGKYLAEVNLRYDGSSRFRSDKRWGLFPSFSLGWNVAQEDFWSSLSDYVGLLKIRISYGELGNQNTSSMYPTYEIMTTGTSNGNWLIGNRRPNTSRVPSLISATLTWERVQSRNIGFDFSALKNRLTGSFDYFNRYTFDMVGPAPQLPGVLGPDPARTNNTDLKTYGFEFILGWNDRLSNGLRYGAKFTLGDSQTEITRYPNLTGSLTTYRKGQIMGEIWGYTTKGLAKTQEEMDAHLATLPNGGQTAVGSQWRAGDIMYVDTNGDGKIDRGARTLDDHGDWTIIGNSSPRYAFGLDLTTAYKGFDFRAFFQGIMKRDYWSESCYYWGAIGSGIWWSTCMEPHLDYFRDNPDHFLGENLNAYFPRPLYNTSKNQQAQTRYLLDASYIRLKNIQLGYSLPESLLRKIFISKVRLYVSGENLWTGTKMIKTFDPETVEGGYQGNGNVYPLSKTISFGLNLNF